MLSTVSYVVEDIGGYWAGAANDSVFCTFVAF